MACMYACVLFCKLAFGDCKKKTPKKVKKKKITSFLGRLCFQKKTVFSLSSAGQVSDSTEAESCVLFISSCPAVVVQPQLGGVGSPWTGVQASAAAWVEAGEEPAGLCCRQAPVYPQGEGVLSWAAQQGVCVPVAEPQAGGVWDQV